MKEYEGIIVFSSSSFLEIDLSRFRDIELALQKRVVLLLLNYLYPNEKLWLSHSLIDQIHSQCLERDGSSEVHLPKGRKGYRHYSTMFFSFDGANSSAPTSATSIDIGQWHSVGWICG